MAQPSLRDGRGIGRLPRLESRGYYHKSLRDLPKKSGGPLLLSCCPNSFALAKLVSALENHDSPMLNITRRQFLEDSILAAAAAASIPTPLLAGEQRAVSANDKITVAIIGCGIRGKQHAGELARLPDCEIAYVCDPDRDRAAEVATDLVAKKRPKPKAIQDLRVILDDKSVAAVFIARPQPEGQGKPYAP